MSDPRAAALLPSGAAGRVEAQLHDERERLARIGAQFAQDADGDAAMDFDDGAVAPAGVAARSAGSTTTTSSSSSSSSSGSSSSSDDDDDDDAAPVLDVATLSARADSHNVALLREARVLASRADQPAGVVDYQALFLPSHQQPLESRRDADIARNLGRQRRQRVVGTPLHVRFTAKEEELYERDEHGSAEQREEEELRARHTFQVHDITPRLPLQIRPSVRSEPASAAEWPVESFMSTEQPAVPSKPLGAPLDGAFHPVSQHDWENDIAWDDDDDDDDDDGDDDDDDDYDDDGDESGAPSRRRIGAAGPAAESPRRSMFRSAADDDDESDAGGGGLGSQRAATVAPASQNAPLAGTKRTASASGRSGRSGVADGSASQRQQQQQQPGPSGTFAGSTGLSLQLISTDADANQTDRRALSDERIVRARLRAQQTHTYVAAHLHAMMQRLTGSAAAELGPKRIVASDSFEMERSALPYVNYALMDEPWEASIAFDDSEPLARPVATIDMNDPQLSLVLDPRRVQEIRVPTNKQHAFNVSNEEFYAQLRRNKAQRKDMSMVEHTMHAARLEWFRSLSPVDHNRFHRPLIFMTAGASWPLRIVPESQTRMLQDEVQLSAVDLRRMTRDDLHATDSKVILVEYAQEQNPILLCMPGMVSRVLHYYRKRSATDTFAQYRRERGIDESAFDGDVIELDPLEKTPFFGEVHPGEVVNGIGNNLYFSPLVRHDAAASDFLVIKQGTGLSLRPLPPMFAAGQQQPRYEVPAPGSRIAIELRKQLYMGFVLRGIKNGDTVRTRDMVQLFHDSSRMTDARRLGNDMQRIESAIRHALEPLGVRPVLGVWGLSKDVRVDRRKLISEERLQKLCSPEVVCAMDSMEAGLRILRARGVQTLTTCQYLEQALDRLFTTGQSSDREKALRYVESALRLTPWAQSQAFVGAQASKFDLTLTGVDPTGRGEAFSFVRSVNVRGLRPGEKKEVRKIAKTNADLRKLTKDELNKYLIDELGVPAEEAYALPRWKKVGRIREASSRADQQNEDARERFARDTRPSATQQRDFYERKRNEIFKEMMAYLRGERTDGDDVDIEQLVDSFIMQDGSAAEAALGAGDDDDEEAELQRMMQQQRDAPLKRLKEMLNPDDDVDDDDDDVRSNDPMSPGAQPQFAAASRNAPDRPVLVRVLSHAMPDGSIRQEYKIIRDASLVSAFEANRPLFDEVASNAREAEQSYLRRVRRRFEERRKKASTRPSSGDDTPRPSGRNRRSEPKAGLRCTKCGGTGHMSTNKTCPLYYDTTVRPKLKRDRSGEKRRRHDRRRADDDDDDDDDDGDVAVRAPRAPRTPSGIKSYFTALYKSVEAYRQKYDKEGIFFQPAVAHGYDDIIERRMDFSQLFKSARSGGYKTIRAFWDDAQLVLANCIRYNASVPQNSWLIERARKLLGWIHERLVRDEKRCRENDPTFVTARDWPIDPPDLPAPPSSSTKVRLKPLAAVAASSSSDAAAAATAATADSTPPPARTAHPSFVPTRKPAAALAPPPPVSAAAPVPAAAAALSAGAPPASATPSSSGTRIKFAFSSLSSALSPPPASGPFSPSTAASTLGLNTLRSMQSATKADTDEEVDV